MLQLLGRNVQFLYHVLLPDVVPDSHDDECIHSWYVLNS